MNLAGSACNRANGANRGMQHDRPADPDAQPAKVICQSFSGVHGALPKVFNFTGKTVMGNVSVAIENGGKLQNAPVLPCLRPIGRCFMKPCKFGNRNAE